MRGAIAIAGLVGALLGACQDPPLRIVYQVTDGDTQSCGQPTCTAVKMECDAVLNVRIVSPSHPNTPYVSVCRTIQSNREKDLCAIAAIELDPTTLPDETLEVQVLVWPASAVTDQVTGDLNCRQIDVEFDRSTGFPIDQTPSPAIGGHAYFHPGDSETVVTLGCTDIMSLNDSSCIGPGRVEVGATVEDFDTHVSVSSTTADQLQVSVGEPQPSGSEYDLKPGDTRALSRTASTPIPAWNDAVDLTFMSTACLEVFQDVPEAVTTLACQPAGPTATMLNPTGVLMTKGSLQQILGALGMASFPAEGMTVGIVLDDQGNPAANLVVTPSAGTVQYLSADRTSAAGTFTSSSGVFVSTDAPYHSTFSTSSGQLSSATVLGGRVQGKLTIVKLQLTHGVGG